MSVGAEIAALHALAQRMSEPWPAEERLLAWQQEKPVRPGVRLLGNLPHALSIYAGSREAMAARRAEIQGMAAAMDRTSPSQRRRNDRSWMPSIAGVGAIVLRWPAETVQPEIEEWRTYEAIRAGCRWTISGLSWLDWIRIVPGACRSDAVAALSAERGSQPLDTEESLGNFARAVADRLAPRPITLPAVTKHLGALPRDRWMQNMRRKLGPRDLDPAHRCHRSTLGALAARYTPRRPDGTYNRHDARRWMRAFARAVAVASDALLEGDRLRAVEVLCECAGLEDAWALTERPSDARRDGWVNAPMFSASADRLDGWVGLLDGPAMTRPAPPWASATPEEILADIDRLADRGFESQYNQQPPPTRDELYPALTATGTALDAVAAQVGLRRHPRSPHGIHPETDADLRRRIEAALFGAVVDDPDGPRERSRAAVRRVREWHREAVAARERLPVAANEREDRARLARLFDAHIVRGEP